MAIVRPTTLVPGPAGPTGPAGPPGTPGAEQTSFEIPDRASLAVPEGDYWTDPWYGRNVRLVRTGKVVHLSGVFLVGDLASPYSGAAIVFPEEYWCGDGRDNYLTAISYNNAGEYTTIYPWPARWGALIIESAPGNAFTGGATVWLNASWQTA